jgi:hypothetical protein
MCQTNEKNPPALEAGRGVVVVHPLPVGFVVVPLHCCPSVVGGIGVGIRCWRCHLALALALAALGVGIGIGVGI